MKKLSLSLLFALLLVGILATSASAEPNWNANETGQGDSFEELIKTLDMLDNEGHKNDQKVHGSYQNNTNSCASCHQTHTASAQKILFTDSSSTCMSCHDGTLGFYDVMATGEEYFASSSTAGTFGGDVERNASAHNVKGNIQVRAAPGGNTNGSGTWTEAFTCASCHAPHGSYSDRLLHYNPNNMANTPVGQGGRKLVNVPIVGAGQTSSADYYMVVEGNEMTLRDSDGEKVTDIWLNSGFVFKNSAGENITTRPGGRYGLQNFDIDHHDAVVRSGHLPVSDLIGGTADIPRVFVIELPKDESYVGATNLDWKHDLDQTLSSESTRQLSTFCGSCHQDYFKGSTSQQATSQWDPNFKYYGHTTANANERSCISCHYAHGNDVDIIVDAQSRTVFDLVDEKGWSLDQARNYMQDQNPSSALKKWTNMAGCFACHNSSRNTYFANQPHSDEQPSGYITDPSRR